MKKYPINAQGMKIAMTAIGVIIILLGIGFAGLDVSEWIKVVGAIGVGLVILTQIGIKRLTSYSKLQSLSYGQFLSVVTSIVIIATGILNIPYFGIQWAFINSATAVALIVGGVVFVKEAWW
jgi:hypothetical protein